VTTWGHVFLGAIAVSTVLMALIQVGAILFAARLAVRVNKLADRVEHEMKPLVASLNAISTDAARATALTVAQLERADKAVDDLATRAEATMNLVQNALVAPAREGVALVSGLKAALASVREMKDRRSGASGRADDEDALFI
jgi:hypothetical protein